MRKRREPPPPKKRAGMLRDEHVLLEVRPSRLSRLPRFVTTLGLYAFWRKRDTSVVTNRRILLSRGILRRQERSIPVDAIHHVRFVRRGVAGYAEFNVEEQGHSRHESVGPLSPKDARRLTSEILEQL